MHLVSPRRIGALAVSATALTAVAALVLAGPVSAAPVFTDLETHAEGDSGADDRSGNCSTPNTNAESPPTPVMENGAPTSTAASVSGNAVNTLDATDTATYSASSAGTSSVRSAGGNPAAIDLAVSGSAVVDFAHPAASGCTLEVYAGHELEFTFTVAQAGYLHLRSSAPAGFYGQVELFSDTDPGDPYYESYGYGLKFRATQDIFLPPGTYDGDFEGYVAPVVNVDRSVSGTVSVHADFVVAGTQTAAPAGKGTKYVSLGARTCATHSVAASVTAKKKRAADVKQVSFFVNDAKVKTVKKPHKGDAVTLTVADDQAADVRAVVKLFPAKKGKPGKELEVGASYEACS